MLLQCKFRLKNAVVLEWKKELYLIELFLIYKPYLICCFFRNLAHTAVELKRQIVQKKLLMGGTAVKLRNG